MWGTLFAICSSRAVVCGSNHGQKLRQKTDSRCMRLTKYDKTKVNINFEAPPCFFGGMWYRSGIVIQ